MLIDKEYFEGWMQRLNSKLDDVVNKLDDPGEEVPLFNGEKLLDNHDVCQMLNVSKRTLQRYRSSGELPFQMIYHKTFYKETDVMKFIDTHFSRFHTRRNRKQKK
ncbi:Helix-turn-helix domain-containing protein [Mariniphaga anaerophila]|uniref:Helix-turn-helix domain-containing protein n=1 Tax=Mariniphaga anaerophila TaxID=1484053 RepID=A0A1M4TZV9_9BACT|nr:helix-turn-helix domain-containing protein [Mariniphaga anaerophila]SHE50015.1 Helix-turn-helix domain-containing protein [Mariniphaga anaerophila]